MTSNCLLEGEGEGRRERERESPKRKRAENTSRLKGLSNRRSCLRWRTRRMIMQGNLANIFSVAMFFGVWTSLYVECPYEILISCFLLDKYEINRYSLSQFMWHCLSGTEFKTNFRNLWSKTSHIHLCGDKSFH